MSVTPGKFYTLGVMEDASPHTTLPDDVNELKRLLVACPSGGRV